MSLWRRRFRAARINGLHDEIKPGRPRTHDEERLAQLVNTVLSDKPAASTHWSVRTLAEAATSISKSTVQRYLNLFGVQPHRAKSFKLSNDPFFIEKVSEIVGLYLNPPHNALVLCVDEKSQCQALERNQPVVAEGARICRRHHPRLRASRHHHALCRSGHRQSVLLAFTGCLAFFSGLAFTWSRLQKT